MKKIDKRDLSLNPKHISNLNENHSIRVPTSKEDCNTEATCQTHCAQATCPDYSKADENCKETFATVCLCGGNSDVCNTTGCGSQSGGLVCCETGNTCNNCGVLSQDNNCESYDYIKCDETVNACGAETKQINCIDLTKGNDDAISKCLCQNTLNVNNCNFITRKC